MSQEGSAFAEWGSLCHSIFEDFAKGNLAVYELGQTYVDRYFQYVKNEFPPSWGELSLADRYYERGYELFLSFEGFPEEWEILGVEQEISLQIGDQKFIGFIDLLVRDRNTKELIVVDHKSKGKFKNKAEQYHYAMQLYLYAAWVYETYGEYPAWLLFNMFRVGEEVRIKFELEKLDEAKRWFSDTIKAIYEDTEFWDKITLEYESENKSLMEYEYDDFFCCYLCGSRKYCRQSGQLLESEDV